MKRYPIEAQQVIIEIYLSFFKLDAGAVVVVFNPEAKALGYGLVITPYYA